VQHLLFIYAFTVNNDIGGDIEWRSSIGKSTKSKKRDIRRRNGGIIEIIKLNSISTRWRARVKRANDARNKSNHARGASFFQQWQMYHRGWRRGASLAHAGVTWRWRRSVAKNQKRWPGEEEEGVHRRNVASIISKKMTQYAGNRRNG